MSTPAATLACHILVLPYPSAASGPSPPPLPGASLHALLTHVTRASLLPACLPQSTAALPFGTIVIIIFLWSLITFPLTVLGGIAAKNAKVEFNAPCRCAPPHCHDGARAPPGTLM